ncbi:hypothetical protein [Phytoactinopolyspora mesophila]|uniref:Uncharacterized protein n=1 Tax=Phytoactinopolyspora mesophila TaxID=2650750 RepID=A0A7K3M869_9ACTN|nr:hypothetical protein [Phytoactinopolyspora mesophila]NDL59539.1 hypothetical protein [Phytoactinopolyspora mesophila]
MTEQPDDDAVAGLYVSPQVFTAALLGALIRQAGGRVTVSERAYKKEAARVMEGLRTGLTVERSPKKGHFSVRMISDQHTTDTPRE